MSALWPIVLQKSPSRLCEIEICNNRIGASVLLNRCCSFVPDLESMFRDQMQKILLQHNLAMSRHEGTRNHVQCVCGSLLSSRRFGGWGFFKVTEVPMTNLWRGAVPTVRSTSGVVILACGSAGVAT